jgi:2-C-methyl-D-erythritol 2,4-cyclodiphosphate synthase
VSVRIGSGVDIHCLEEGIPLKLGGVEIPSRMGLRGHSDGDALLHAVASALLGALALGDLGTHFPSSDPTLKGLDSRQLLRQVVALITERGYRVSNLDSTVIAQAPRLAPHRAAMRASIAGCLEIPVDRVSVKAATSDHLGYTGRKEGIVAHATVLLVRAESG